MNNKHTTDSNGVSSVKQTNRQEVRGMNMSGVQGLTIAAAGYDLAGLSMTDDLKQAGMSNAGFLAFEESRVVLELTEAVKVMSKQTDLGASGNYYEQDVWRAWTHVGLNLAKANVSFVADSSMDYATYRIQAAEGRSLDSATTGEMSKSVTSATLGSTSREMRSMKERAVGRMVNQASGARDNNDARGYAFAVLGRLVAHNSAMRHKLVDNKLVEMHDDEKSVADTYLTWEVACAHGTGEIAITPVPPQWADSRRTMTARERILAESIAMLTPNDIGSVQVSVTGVTFEHGATAATVRMEPHHNPHSWVVDNSVLSTTTRQGCGSGEHYTVWKGRHHKVFMTMQVKQLISRMTVASDTVEPEANHLVYYLRGLEGHFAAAEFLLANSRQGGWSHLPGVFGVIADLHEVSYPHTRILGIAGVSAELPDFTFSKAELATAAFALMRRFDVSEPASHYALTNIGYMMAAAVARDLDNGSLSPPAFRFALPPLYVQGVQFWDMNNVEGSTSVHNMGIAKDLLTATYAVGAVAHLANLCEVGAKGEEGNALPVSRSKDALSVATATALKAPEMQSGDLSVRGSNVVKSDYEVLLAQRMRDVFPNMSEKDTRLYRMNLAYGPFVDTLYSRVRASLVSSIGTSALAMDASSLLKRNNGFAYKWHGDKGHCGVPFVLLPVPAATTHHATPAVASEKWLGVRAWDNERVRNVNDLAWRLGAAGEDNGNTTIISYFRHVVAANPYGTAEATAALVLAASHMMSKGGESMVRATDGRAANVILGAMLESRTSGEGIIIRPADAVASCAIRLTGRMPLSLACMLPAAGDEAELNVGSTEARAGRMSTSPEAHRRAAVTKDYTVELVTNGEVRHIAREEYHMQDQPTLHPRTAALALRPYERYAVQQASTLHAMASGTVPVLYAGATHGDIGDQTPLADRQPLPEPSYENFPQRLPPTFNLGRGIAGPTLARGVLRDALNRRKEIGKPKLVPQTEVCGGSSTAGGATRVEKVVVGEMTDAMLNASPKMFERLVVQNILYDSPGMDNAGKADILVALNAARSWPDVLTVCRKHPNQALASAPDAISFLNACGIVWGEVSGDRQLQLIMSSVVDDFQTLCGGVATAVEQRQVPTINKTAIGTLYYQACATGMGLHVASMKELDKLKRNDGFTGYITYSISRTANWRPESTRRKLVNSWNEHARVIASARQPAARMTDMDLKQDLSIEDVLALPVYIGDTWVITLGDVTAKVVTDSDVREKAAKVTASYRAIDLVRRQVAKAAPTRGGEVLANADIMVRTASELRHLVAGTREFDEEWNRRTLAYVLMVSFLGRMTIEAEHGAHTEEDYVTLRDEWESSRQAIEIPEPGVATAGLRRRGG